MSDTAIGLIETEGLVGVLEAADTAAKAADVQLLGVERVGGGLVSVRFRGDTAAVKAAVSAASDAASRLTRVVSAHVIPSPAIDVVAGPLTGGPLTGGPLTAGAAAPAGVGRTASVPTAGAAPPPVAADTDLASLPVARLRQLARQTSGLALQGRQISRANKQQLLDALRRAGLP
jgi:ethanolamine utilization protein EutM